MDIVITLIKHGASILAFNVMPVFQKFVTSQDLQKTKEICLEAFQNSNEAIVMALEVAALVRKAANEVKIGRDELLELATNVASAAIALAREISEEEQDLDVVLEAEDYR